jgi:hypothetical protein
LSVMLYGYLDDDIWEALVELSYFYRQLYAKEIKKIWWRSWRRKYLCFYAN